MWFIVKPLKEKSKVVVLSRLRALFISNTNECSCTKNSGLDFPHVSIRVITISQLASACTSECASLDQKRHFNVDSSILMPAAYVRVPASLSGNHWKSFVAAICLYTSNPSKHVCARACVCCTFLRAHKSWRLNFHPSNHPDRRGAIANDCRHWRPQGGLEWGRAGSCRHARRAIRAKRSCRPLTPLPALEKILFVMLALSGFWCVSRSLVKVEIWSVLFVSDFSWFTK